MLGPLTESKLCSFKFTSSIIIARSMDARKKRKLPKDLTEASKQARAYLVSSNKIVEACELLKTIELPVSSKDISEHHISTYLIGRYGLNKIARICSVLSGFPMTLNTFHVSKYISKLTDMDDAHLLASFITTHCPDLIATFTSNPPSPTLLAPPVSNCFECQRQLTSNHDCEVSILITRKFTLQQYT